MAIMGSVPPILKLIRSPQSGSKGMTGNWVVVYTETCPLAYIFGGAEIDLSPMQAGDVIQIRVRKQILVSGALTPHHEVTYTGAQPATHTSVHISAIPDVHGVEVAMLQSAGVLRNIDCEFFDAKRLGLA